MTTIMRHISRYTKKLRVYQWYLNGSFDRKDNKRLKPLTRLRRNMNEIEMERSGSKKLRVKDWYKDIDRGYSK